MLAFINQLSKCVCLWLKQPWTPHSLESIMCSPRTTNPDFKDSTGINDLNGLWETCHGFISCLPSFGVCLDSQVRNGYVVTHHRALRVFLMGKLQRRRCSAISLSLSLSPSPPLSLSLSHTHTHTHTHTHSKEGNHRKWWVYSVKSELAALTCYSWEEADTVRRERRKDWKGNKQVRWKQLGAKEDCSNTNTLNSGLVQEQGHRGVV